MSTINVVYWSQTGNTQVLAQAIGQGIIEAGKEAKVIEADNVLAGEFKDCPVIALGCPAMGAEELEDSVMEPFVSEYEKFAAGKKVALFGSYGWGDGEWMRQWVDRMTAAGAEVINGEGLICQESPDDVTVAQCRELGKQLANF